MRIAVLGVGSIGGVLLGALSDTDCDLLAISRGISASNLSSMGLVPVSYTHLTLPTILLV